MKTLFPLLLCLGFAGVAIRAGGQPAPAQDVAAPAPKVETGSAAEPAGDPSNPWMLTETAPASYKAQFKTTKGVFVVEVTRADAPRGADRFFNLVKSGFFTEVAFFRVVPGFVVQFGIHGDPKIAQAWRSERILDDPVKSPNRRGTLSFATSGPRSRTTQVFINLTTNASLDGQGFSPFGKVVAGLDVVDKLNGEYGEGAPGGKGPDQRRVEMEGNPYLKKNFSRLDYIKSAAILK